MTDEELAQLRKEWDDQVNRCVAAIKEVSRTGTAHMKLLIAAAEAQSTYNLAFFEMQRQAEFMRRLAKRCEPKKEAK